LAHPKKEKERKKKIDRNMGLQQRHVCRDSREKENKAVWGWDTADYSMIQESNNPSGLGNQGMKLEFTLTP
jgi:hypothetical protein